MKILTNHNIHADLRATSLIKCDLFYAKSLLLQFAEFAHLTRTASLERSARITWAQALGAAVGK